MNHLIKLDDTNFLLYAAHHYDNPSCYDTVEFYDDLKRFKYLKRLFNKYKDTRELKERLILNHIIVLYNLFGPEAATRMLFFKLEGYYNYLAPFLVFLGFLPTRVENIGLQGKTVITSDIDLDNRIVEMLRRI